MNLCQYSSLLVAKCKTHWISIWLGLCKMRAILNSSIHPSIYCMGHRFIKNTYTLNVCHAMQFVCIIHIRCLASCALWWMGVAQPTQHRLLYIYFWARNVYICYMGYRMHICMANVCIWKYSIIHVRRRAIHSAYTLTWCKIYYRMLRHENFLSRARVPVRGWLNIHRGPATANDVGEGTNECYIIDPDASHCLL